MAGASPSRRPGNWNESPSHTSKLTENARKIATPPKRGSGASCRCRPSRGAETQPLRVAMSRTSRVATNDKTSENANNPKNRRVKVGVPFRLKHPASQATCAAREVSADIFQTEFPLSCDRVMKWLFEELYNSRSRSATIPALFIKNFSGFQDAETERSAPILLWPCLSWY